ncbi:MAG: response regulator [Planctomycetota bacterium]|jgi:DNA-binding NarL/FixJ family response regulator
MIRQRPYVKTTEVVNDEKKQLEVQEGKGRIWAVDGDPAVWQELIQLVNEEADLRVYTGANTTAGALGSLDVQQADLGIVDISMDCKKGEKLVDQIRMRCSRLPLLILSIQDKALRAVRASRVQVGEYIINQKTSRKIVEVVRYIESLLDSGVCGFTIVVEVNGKE